MVMISLVLCFFMLKGVLMMMRFMRVTGITPGLVARLTFDDGVKLKSSSDRTNILLLGIGGGTHAGADLTDTMMVVSLNAQDRSVEFISIPRDIWSDTLKDKVNSAYHYGEEKKQGGGMLLAKVISEDVVGIPIHYGMLVDFSGFKEIISELGGVDVNVSRAFTDNDFPIDGKENDTCPGDPTNRCVYETIHFDAGLQHMDGATALKYARSRHAEGEEGGDFARSRRQQDLLVAVKDKITHPSQWFSFENASTLLRVTDNAVDSDMNIAELVSVAKRIASMKDNETQKISLDQLLFEPPTYLYGKYVLVPKGDWKTVHEYIKHELGIQ